MAELADYIQGDEVRAALDPAGLVLDASTLPDAVISRQIYAGAAVAEVLRADPEAASREGDALARIKNALNLLTAARIAPFVTQITKERLDEADTTYQAVDWAARGEALRRTAYEEIAAVTRQGGHARSMPQMFGLARGGRGRY